MKEQLMDIFLLAAMYLGVYAKDYRPHKQQRSTRVNVCYLVLLLLSAAIMAMVLLFPAAPRLADWMMTLTGKAG